MNYKEKYEKLAERVSTLKTMDFMLYNCIRNSSTAFYFAKRKDIKMIYRVKFEDHYDEEWYYEHECLIKVSDSSEIEKRLKSNYSPKDYIKILSIDKFILYDGEIFDITKIYGAVG